MIKRLSFGIRGGHVAAGLRTPADVRPLRVVAGPTLPAVTEDDLGYDGIAIEWFRDDAHLARFQECASEPATGVVVVVADEVVVRGADWLEQRWREGGVRYKHLAVARRAEGLSAAEFSARWLGHAGRLSSTVVIPDDVRGCAYVQNHVRGEGVYHAVNEVWFDDAPSLWRRAGYFRDAVPPSDLVSWSAYLATREYVLRGG
ncbi:hypothetical protein [Cryptosporangium aurantiacum]|uniref:EthD domain-containing protein n=1 Tax=Cryptosporangium aurantiacum TaxID=134849 RepID=A0A1M7KI81_9ACTN|nr:hypothetical protein [Cryptosporangium aurantiacum]SHM65109.1 hypothetical protein SAMN05443668_1011144 [Cryptosporangium aurantiacum]